MALGGMPNDPRRLSISRHASPTSMSKLTEPFETKVTLPLLPLPKTEICRAIGCLRRQYTEEAPPTGSCLRDQLFRQRFELLEIT
jgi:hypothetical protein